MKDQTVVQQRQHIQDGYPMQDPLFIQHEQRKDQDTGHGWYIIKAGFMYAEEKEFGQHHSRAQIFVKRIRPKLCNVQNPHAAASCCYRQNHPVFP